MKSGQERSHALNGGRLYHVNLLCFPSGGDDFVEFEAQFSLQPMSVNGNQLCIPIETLSDGDNTEPAESFFVQATFEDGVDPASATATVDIGGR
jgi:hypothetical protein